MDKTVFDDIHDAINEYKADTSNNTKEKLNRLGDKVAPSILTLKYEEQLLAWNTVGGFIAEIAPFGSDKYLENLKTFTENVLKIVKTPEQQEALCSGASGWDNVFYKKKNKPFN